MKIRRYDVLAMALSLSIFLGFTMFGLKYSGESGYLLIEDQYGQSLYPLSEDTEVTLDGPIGESVIQIKNGEARFLHSDCSDDLCVQMGPITESGDWAACLPNRVFLTITGGEEKEGGVDAGVY